MEDADGRGFWDAEVRGWRTRMGADLGRGFTRIGGRGFTRIERRGEEIFSTVF
jgi:hypothetical protein